MGEHHKASVKGSQQSLPEVTSESAGWTRGSYRDGKGALGTAKTQAQERESATSNTMLLG